MKTMPNMKQKLAIVRQVMQPELDLRFRRRPARAVPPPPDFEATVSALIVDAEREMPLVPPDGVLPFLSFLLFLSLVAISSRLLFVICAIYNIL